MRASPAFALTVERFTLWRAALVAWVVATAAALVTWAWLMAPTSGSFPGIVAAGFVLATLWAAKRLASTEPLRLEWDQQCWHCGSTLAGHEPAVGALDVTIDLGVWMMLRFIDGSSGRRRWIAVQRGGLEGQWHALRCAVYSPRPEAGGLPDDTSQRAAPGASQRASSRIDPAA